MSKKNSIEDVRKVIESKGAKLLSNEYYSNKTPLLIEFSDGEIEYRTFNNIKNKNGVLKSKKQKYENLSKKQIRSLEKIKSIIESKGGKLLSNEYKNRYEPLLIETKDGVIEKRTMNSIVQCKELLSWEGRYQKQSEKQKLSFDEVKEIVEKRGGKLLSTSKYINNRTYFSFVCSCGKVTYNCIFNIKQNYDFLTCENCRPSSQFEEEVLYFIKSIYSGRVIRNDRELIYPQELDIVIPEKQLAIECNGIYWHSETIKPDKKYHLNKTNKVREKGYRLIHINDSEWNFYKPILCDLISKTLGVVKERVYARKCKIRELSAIETKEFLEKNHLQGYIPSKYRYGLFWNGKLVSVMTFSKPRFGGVAEYELCRFSNLIGVSVLGGFSKLLSHFVKKLSPNTIISFCDIAHFSGKIYEDNGFKLINVSPPNYKYFTKRDYILHSRNKFQKHKLSRILEKYDPSLTEYENMRENNYHRIWDCGNYVYLFCSTTIERKENEYN